MMAPHLLVLLIVASAGYLLWFGFDLLPGQVAAGIGRTADASSNFGLRHAGPPWSRPKGMSQPSASTRPIEFSSTSAAHTSEVVSLTKRAPTLSARGSAPSVTPNVTSSFFASGRPTDSTSTRLSTPLTTVLTSTPTSAPTTAPTSSATTTTAALHFTGPRFWEVANNWRTEPRNFSVPTVVPRVNPPSPVGFLVENPDVCQRDDVYRALDGDPLVVMMIVVAANNQDSRRNIREYWDRYATKDGLTLSYSFVVGRPEDEQLLADLMSEAAEHGDILLLDSVETYRRLAYKSMGMFQYVDKHCSHVKALVKVDHDVILHVPNLVAGLRAADEAGRLAEPGVIGNIFWRGGLLRNPKHKNHETQENWPDSMGKLYPTYASGPSYIVTMAAVKQFVHEPTGFRIMSNEDVNTGLLAMQNKTPMYKWNALYFFLPSAAEKKFGDLMTEAPCDIPVVGLHGVSSKSADSLWRGLVEKWGQCDVDYRKFL